MGMFCFCMASTQNNINSSIGKNSSVQEVIKKGKKNKVVGLIQVRNEAEVIEHCLRGLSLFTDAIVVLDDNSQDNTRVIVESLAGELHIERVIVQPYSGWQKTSEAHNRQTLLEAGRAVGGTHFILIDADELFMATCGRNNWLQRKIVSLKPGQILSMPMVNVWGDALVYRDDEYLSPHQSPWSKKPVIFCDDGQCSYSDCSDTAVVPEILHGCRVPLNMVCKEFNKQIIVRNINHGIVHFKWANFDNIYVKKRWYMMLEYMRANEHSQDREANLKRIIHYYDKGEFKGTMPEEQGITLKTIRKEWYAYPFFDATVYTHYNYNRERDIREWLNAYGVDYFLAFSDAR